MIKINSQRYNYQGYDIDIEVGTALNRKRSICKSYCIRFLPALTFDSLRKIKIAIDAWRKGSGNYKQWFNKMWIISIDPKNYNDIYGRLTKKRLALRKKLLQ